MSLSNLPTTLKGFGYDFNKYGQLRQIDKKTEQLTDKPFDFKLSPDTAINQRYYEALGDVIVQYVYELLEKEGLHKIYIPENVDKEKASFIYATRKDLTNAKKLLILIHGSGAVRAGQWARSLIVNESINHGTQIPYIKKAKELGYDVLITNTNDNSNVPENRTPESHASYVWEHFVQGMKAENVAIVAHSYGGHVVMKLAEQYSDFFIKHVFALGLTDAIHSYSLDDNTKNHLNKIGRHWVTSVKPLNTLLRTNDIPQYSAGHTKHEWTSWACMEAVFEYFEDKYSKINEERPAKIQKTNDEF